MVAAANSLLSVASPAEKKLVSHPLNSKVWRMWGNPEIYINRYGLRLDAVGESVRQAAMGVLRASLSSSGYAKACDCMFMNRFLGEIMNARAIMNEFSYNFNLFGAPSSHEPWGWQLYGHHLVMNCLVLGGQMVMTPCFWGAEPNEVDEGPRMGLRLFQDEESLGLAFMKELPDALRGQALLASGVDDAALPAGRVHIADNLHLAGAYQDNRIIPYEGLNAGELGNSDKSRFMGLVEAYHRHLPEGPRNARVGAIEAHLHETYFCWIGGYDDESPFYYRIQSPVTIIEFDHHAGIFLTNRKPEKFHIHTLMRTPNGNDYGMALVRAHCEAHQRNFNGAVLS
jgi:hypothetical protein